MYLTTKPLKNDMRKESYRRISFTYTDARILNFLKYYQPEYRNTFLKDNISWSVSQE